MEKPRRSNEVVVRAMIAPCKSCTERYSACHDTCEKYQEWHKENIRVKSEMKRDIAISYLNVEGYRRRNRNWLRQSYLNKK